RRSTGRGLLAPALAVSGLVALRLLGVRLRLGGVLLVLHLGGVLVLRLGGVLVLRLGEVLVVRVMLVMLLVLLPLYRRTRTKRVVVAQVRPHGVLVDLDRLALVTDRDFLAVLGMGRADRIPCLPDSSECGKCHHRA